jgi:hypothetical protein
MHAAVHDHEGHALRVLRRTTGRIGEGCAQGSMIHRRTVRASRESKTICPIPFDCDDECAIPQAERRRLCQPWSSDGIARGHLPELAQSWTEAVAFGHCRVIYHVCAASQLQCESREKDASE